MLRGGRRSPGLSWAEKGGVKIKHKAYFERDFGDKC
jgi:hypothetical protein